MLNISVRPKRKGYDYFGRKLLCPMEHLRNLIIFNNWNLKGNKNKFYLNIFPVIIKLPQTQFKNTSRGKKKIRIIIEAFECLRFERLECR